MARHQDLDEANMHEPKGMTVATAGAADVGKVVASNGNGSTTVRKLIPEEVGVTEDHGQLTISNNAVPINISAAADSTLATNTDYIPVVGVWDAVPHGLNRGVTQQTNSLTAVQTGVYRVEVWLDAAASVTNTAIAFKFAVDGVIGLVRRPKTFLANIGEFHNLAAFGVVALTSGEVVTLLLAGDKNANITIEDAVFMLTLIHAT